MWIEEKPTNWINYAALLSHHSKSTSTPSTHVAANKRIVFVHPVRTFVTPLYESETKGCSETEKPTSAVLSVNLTGLLVSSSASPVGCSRGFAAVTGPATAGGGVVSSGSSDWLRGQMLAKLPQSAPQCCLHCPRSCRPTHALISSPHFNRKFISSTYGLGWKKRAGGGGETDVHWGDLI